MIRVTDTTILAFTKLRARKIRTIITILLASLLFGMLIAASLVMTGAFRSVDTFRQDGLTSRHIVNVNKAINDPSVLSKLLRDPALIAEAKKRYETLVKEKTDEAKKLNITYTQASDQPPYTIGSDGTERLAINDQNGIVHDLLKEKFSNEPAFDDAKLKTIAERYHATKLFTSENDTITRNASLEVLKDNKEVFYDQTDEAALNKNHEQQIIDGGQMTLTPEDITKPFMLPNNGGWKPNGASLPIILPQNNIEQLLGLAQLPDNATTHQKLDRLKTIRERAVNLTFRACYRNSESKALVQQTIQQQKDIKANEGKKEYEKPARIYALPGPTTCENPVVTSDTRTADEKKTDANQEIFDDRFKKDEKPTSYFVSFQIVGISPVVATQNDPANDQSNTQSRNVNDVINNLLATTGIGQVIPEELYNQLPDKTKYSDLFTYDPMYLFGNEDNKQRYVEFANSSDAQKFIDEQSCTVQRDSTCKPSGREYQATLAFSNSAALDDMQRLARQWFSYLIFGVIILAAIVMWITIGRTIADGRHETAIFRAIGFKRLDIAMIYILYTVILSLLVAVFAACIGWIGAYSIDNYFAPELTAHAQYGFGGLDLSKEVSLIGFNWQQLSLILVACFATGMLSILLPLVRNVRRSPIRDMRKE